MGRLISLVECRGLCSQRRVVALNTIYCRGQHICCWFLFYLGYFLLFIPGARLSLVIRRLLFTTGLLWSRCPINCGFGGMCYHIRFSQRLASSVSLFGTARGLRVSSFKSLRRTHCIKHRVSAFDKWRETGVFWGKVSMTFQIVETLPLLSTEAPTINGNEKSSYKMAASSVRRIILLFIEFEFMMSTSQVRLLTLWWDDDEGLLRSSFCKRFKSGVIKPAPKVESLLEWDSGSVC